MSIALCGREDLSKFARKQLKPILSAKHGKRKYPVGVYAYLFKPC